MCFEIRESDDGKTWKRVEDDTVYMSAYKKAESRSRTPTLPRFQQVLRVYPDESQNTPMVTFTQGRFHYFEREPTSR